MKAGASVSGPEAQRPALVASHLRRILLTIVTFAVTTVAFVVTILGPPPSHPKQLCGRFVPLVDTHGYWENCDSITFINLAEDPTDLFDERQIRQSRPIFIVMGAVAGVLTRPVGAMLDLSEDGSYRIGYRLINLLLVSAAVALAWQLLRRAGVDAVLRGCVAAILIVNGVTKGFIWTAHTVMFSVLVPVLLMAVAVRVLRHRGIGLRDLTVYGLAGGLAFLAYGSFVLVVPVIIVARVVAQRRAGALQLKRTAAEAGVLTAAFVAPSAVWIAMVRLVAGSYYSAETAEYRQFVWIFDALGEGLGELVSRADHNSRLYADTFVSPDLLPVVLLVAGVGVVVRGRPSSVRDRSRFSADLAVAALIVAVAVFLFQWAMGFYESRLTFMLVPPLIVLVALGVQQDSRHRWLRPAVVVFTVGWIVMQVLREGPFN